jgi:hypothetical protein
MLKLQREKREMAYDWTGETKKSEFAEHLIIALVVFAAGTLTLAFVLTILA